MGRFDNRRLLIRHRLWRRRCCRCVRICRISRFASRRPLSPLGFFSFAKKKKKSGGHRVNFSGVLMGNGEDGVKRVSHLRLLSRFHGGGRVCPCVSPAEASSDDVFCVRRSLMTSCVRRSSGFRRKSSGFLSSEKAGFIRGVKYV